MGIWQIGNIAFCAVNIAAAFYVATKFKELGGSNSRPFPNQSNNNNARPNNANVGNSGFSRASYILCHDPYVAIYILILIGYLIWLSIGVTWRANGSMNCAMNDGNNTLSLVGSSIGLGYSFFSCGFIALCCSLCCSCCCNGDDTNGMNRYYFQNQQNQYGSTNGNPNNRPGNNTTVNHNVAPASASSPATSYTQCNDVETAAPVTATPVAAVPVPSKTAQAQAEPIQATVVPPPSAPPLDNDNDQSAAASGSAFGAKIGKMFNANPETQAKLESTGAKASAAMSSGLKKAKKMFK